MRRPDPAAVLPRLVGADARWDPLPGDASDRRYVRVHGAGGASRIVMLQTAPFDRPWHPFERTTELFREAGLPVPRILERRPDGPALILEDLGDTSLQAHLELTGGPPPQEVRSLYEEAVDLIVRMQRAGTPRVRADHPCYHFALDDVKLGRELDHFRTHYAGALLGGPLSTAEEERLEACLAELAARAGRAGDRVLCHRDFHSRNLMLPAGREPGSRLVMIDHQDARLGPRAYDLASLLCDPYVRLPAGLAEAMTARFLEGIGRAGGAEAFASGYAAVTAQRTLKAAGTFAAQATRFGVDRYLAYLPRALATAREALAGLPELADLGDLLAGRLAWRS